MTNFSQNEMQQLTKEIILNMCDCQRLPDGSLPAGCVLPSPRPTTPVPITIPKVPITATTHETVAPSSTTQKPKVPSSTTQEPKAPSSTTQESKAPSSTTQEPKAPSSTTQSSQHSATSSAPSLTSSINYIQILAFLILITHF
ncbi:unnamed protein product [Anisakis simplex]|uniref:Vegetative cell wall protein gp1-like n=1 Tax=Anisakis simplex TaxID=6269 RepID=A0A0M3J829_ANISI|nr:unnamed protein product [Anisakis simplex]